MDTIFLNFYGKIEEPYLIGKHTSYGQHRNGCTASQQQTQQEKGFQEPESENRYDANGGFGFSADHILYLYINHE